MVWKGDARGRLAKSLIVLIDQVDAKWPNRSRVSDGSIGDPAHAARVSDHNPGDDRVVEALDITHDPEHGVDTWKMAETLRLNRDERIDYVISNGRIFAGPEGPQPWVWRPYIGTNSHAQHIHVSVRPSKMDQTQSWALVAGATSPAPVPPKPKGITAAMRRRMVEAMMAYEGHPTEPKVFIAPDGRPEISGITQKDHPAKYAELKALLDAGQTARLREAILAYYDQYTAPAKNWTDRAGPLFFLSDCILNRGPKGAAEILQDAVGVTVDGQVGPTTRGALAALDVNVAIARLRAARERYEVRVYTKEARVAKRQWDGLVNRWNKAATQATAFQKEQDSTFPVGTTIGVGASGGAAVVAYTFWDWITSNIIPSVIIACGVAAVVVLIVRKIRGD